MINHTKIATVLVIVLMSFSGCAQDRNTNIKRYKSFNGIQFEYAQLLPKDYASDQNYEIIALLCEVHINDKSWERALELVSSTPLEHSIVIVPKVPLGQEHWGTHPIHHGFNDLLKHVRREYGQPNQKMHLIGFEAGQETAFWWTYQSNLLASTSIWKGQLWRSERWDKKWYSNLMDSNIPIYAYEDRVPTVFDMSRIDFKKATSLAQVVKDIESR